MDARDAVLEGDVRPLSGKIFLRLTTPKVSALLELPAHFGGSDCEVIAAPPDSVMRRGDTVLVDRYGMIFPYDDPHDAGSIVMCWERDILCWTIGNELLPFPGWLLCRSIKQESIIYIPESRETVECLEVVLNGNQPETFGELSASAWDRTTERVLVPRIAGFDIVYFSKRWRLVAHQDCLAVLGD